jgi:hypothetical protein
MIVGRRGTSVCLSLRRLIHDPRSGDTLSPVFDVNIVREPPQQMNSSPKQQINFTPLRPNAHQQATPAPAMLPAAQPQQNQPAADDPPVELPPDFDGICGVGINVLEFDGAIIVQKVYPGGPAARSGLVCVFVHVQSLRFQVFLFP